MATIVLTSENNVNHFFNENVIIVYGRPHDRSRPSQESLPLLSGGLHTKDNGQTVITGEIRMKRLSHDQFERLNTFMTEELLFNKYTFSISALEHSDLGMGLNTAITGCNLGINSTEGLWEWRAPDIYNISFPFRYVLEAQ